MAFKLLSLPTRIREPQYRTRYSDSVTGLEKRGILVRFQAVKRDISHSQRVQTESGAHTSSYSAGISDSFLEGVTQTEREADQCPPHIAECKNEWIFPTHTPHGFNRYNIYFTLPVSYSKYPRFKPEGQVPSLRLLVVFLERFSQMQSHCLKFGNNHFLPYPFHFVIHH